MTPRLNALSSPKPPSNPDLPLADDSFDPSSGGFVKKVHDAEIPGILFNLADLKRPEVAPFVANSRKLPEMGLGVYTNPEKKIAALFNPAVITLEELKKVDAAGKLDQVLTPYAQVGAGEATLEETSQNGPPTEITRPAVAQPPILPASRGSQTAASRSLSRPSGDASKQKIPGGGSLLNSLIR